MKLSIFRNATALIIGGSSGIGKAAAKILAEQKCRLLLVSENRQALESVKNELEHLYDVHVDTLTADLSREGGAQSLFASVSALGCQVDICIYSAGIHSSSEQEYGNPSSIRSLLQLHVLKLTEFLLLTAENMIKRKKGYILTVSSITSWFPDPASLVYGPSKMKRLYFKKKYSFVIQKLREPGG